MSAGCFRQALAGGRTQIGLWLGLGDAYTAELCASAGFDWVLIDAEHGPNDLRSILAILQSLAAYPGNPVVRLPHGDPALIKQILETGALSLMVPMVDTAEQARDLVSAMRYPPQGIRGVGCGLARSSRWGADSRYLTEANDRVCLLAQVETVEGLANLAQIVGVDGVDGVFFGPADLSASMGLIGQPGHPDVVAAIENAIDTVVRAGKAAGVLSTDPVLAARYRDRGARFVAVGVDASLLAQSTRTLLSQFRETTSQPSLGFSGY
ncbi:2-keto-3-deoxy-L-rhamnonate aldolase [Pseudomonas sp. S31]|uniref:aldolase/citrate lyase family protein n=1 Tax=Pseudomonas sp. S31 TaxID=1564473 RepID=UPI0019123203|nr:HpcH/HpaI aldolase/citrate lyase family protein [Pseudomonas sp. S31]MBK4999966.1 2-keto-3-deoxy-L-rhamnonate aldolase [Pseudomonas sp. S31]